MLYLRETSLVSVREVKSGGFNSRSTSNIEGNPLDDGPDTPIL